jgi:hypothetical protein
MTAALVSIALVFHPQVAPVSPSGSEGLNRPAALTQAAELVPQREEVPSWLLADAMTAEPNPASSSESPPPTDPIGIESSAGTDSPVETESHVSTPPTSLVQAPPTLSDAQLFRLRMCESTDNYGAHLVWGTQWESRATGAYQFEQPTWDGVASRHMPWLVGVRPHHAWPAEQDAMVRWLWSERGRYPWPHCGLKVGAP